MTDERIKPYELVRATVFEHGPITVEQIAARLRPLSLRSISGALRHGLVSLKRVRKRPDFKRVRRLDVTYWERSDWRAAR